MKYPKISHELSEETGWHIGDGSMNFYKNKKRIKGSYSLRGHISDDRKHYQSRIKPFYKEIYGFDISLREMYSIGCFGFQKWSDELVTFKQKLGLPLGPKLDISIPDKFRKKYQESLIRGIFDTDGNIYLENKNKKLYPRIDISNTSMTLIKQLNNLLQRLKFRSTIYIERREKLGWTDVLRLNVRGEDMVNRWFKIINPQNHKHIGKYQFYVDNS